MLSLARCRAGAGLTGSLFLGALTCSACGGQTGTPGAPYAFSTTSLDATVADVEASVPPAPTVALTGYVRGAASDAGVVGAFVIAEVGGLDGLSSDAGATTTSDPFIRYGALTDDAGAFALSVPTGVVGLHTLATGFGEGRQNAQVSASIDAPSAPTFVSLGALAPADATVPAPPTASRLTPSSLFVAPLASITFAVDIAAGSSSDPLSADVFLVQADTQWAGALSPPTVAVPGGPYPDGDYSLIVVAPSALGAYTYTVVAASLGGVTSVPVSVVVTVTPMGAPPLPDGSFFGVGDAGDGGDFFLDGGGLPDGRR